MQLLLLIAYNKLVYAAPLPATFYNQSINQSIYLHRLVSALLTVV